METSKPGNKDYYAQTRQSNVIVGSKLYIGIILRRLPRFGGVDDMALDDRLA